MRDHYSANIMGYTAPEYRTVVFVALQPEDVFDTIVIAESDVFEEYEDRVGEFTTIANRGISELRFSLEETALDAQARMDGGAQFETIGRDLADGALDEDDLPVLHGFLHNRDVLWTAKTIGPGRANKRPSRRA